MPAFYAHKKFGDEVIERLPDEIKTPISVANKAFILGTQGPDILFNYKPFSKSETKKKGMDLHLSSAKDFFVRAHALAHEKDDAYLAYAIGFICHFVLDNACHPDIYRLENKGFWHGRIESEFDKFLKLYYKEKVFSNATKPLTSKNGASRVCAETLQVEEKAIKKAIHTMKTVNGLFSIKSKSWQKFAGWVLKKVNGETFFAMFLHLDNLPEIDELTPVLHKKYDDAVALAVTLITQFYKKETTVDFFDAFDKDYKGEPIE